MTTTLVVAGFVGAMNGLLYMFAGALDALRTQRELAEDREVDLIEEVARITSEDAKTTMTAAQLETAQEKDLSLVLGRATSRLPQRPVPGRGSR